MLAVCYEKSPKTLTIRRGQNRFHELSDGTKQMEIIPEVLVKFDIVPEKNTEDVFEDPCFMPGGATPRRGSARVRGKMGIEQAAENAGLTPDELVYWLLHDKHYDTPIGNVVVRDDGRKVLGMADWVIEELEGDKRYCRACDKELPARGIQQHLAASKAHQKAMAEWTENLKQKIIELGQEIRPQDAVANL